MVCIHKVLYYACDKFFFSTHNTYFTGPNWSNIVKIHWRFQRHFLRYLLMLVRLDIAFFSVRFVFLIASKNRFTQYLLYFQTFTFSPISSLLCRCRECVVICLNPSDPLSIALPQAQHSILASIFSVDARWFCPNIRIPRGGNANETQEAQKTGYQSQKYTSCVLCDQRSILLSNKYVHIHISIGECVSACMCAKMPIAM